MIAGKIVKAPCPVRENAETPGRSGYVAGEPFGPLHDSLEEQPNMSDNTPPQFAARRRAEFPIFARYPDWSYLDSAATAQKPRALIDFYRRFWSEQNAPLHRGVYRLSAEVTLAYENVRSKVARFLGAARPEEIVFCGGATEAINLVAHSFVAPHLRSGDNILISGTEHHANFVPWQRLCEKTGAELRILPLLVEPLAGPHRDHLQVRWDISSAADLVDKRTKFIALNHVSNVLGTINPVAEICQMARTQGVPVLLDGAQAVVHGTGNGGVDVAALGCDFYVFSAHKLYGPDGVGVLYGRRELLETMPPYQTGGDMIEWVSKEECTFAPPPQRFEAGTMPVSGVLGLEAAIDYFCGLPAAERRTHENHLLRKAGEALQNTFPQIQIIGHESDLTQKVGVLSFVIDGVHPHDMGSILDSAAVAVRAGHHCAQPLMAHLGLAATVRASFAVYNDECDIERLCAGLEKAIRIMA
ncbi:MAG: SufS family cysteine desulfurase [Spirochaetota bacterium]